MDESVISSVIEQLRNSARFSDGDSIDFGLKDVGSVPFSAGNFHGFPENAAQGSRLVFIDGGNSEIFSSPGLCLHFIRIYHTIYRYNKRESCSVDEFYALINAEKRDGRLFYRAKLLPAAAKTLTGSFFSLSIGLDSLHPSLRTGDSRISISKMACIIRRLAELSTALLVMNDLEAGDSVILDGDLDHRTADEAKLIAALKHISLRMDVPVCGLSKTSSLLTKQGLPISFVLAGLTDLPVWYYHPVAGSGQHISFVRFHPRSDYVFRLDSFHSPEEIRSLRILAANSSDPVFIGYPYGLVEADRFARVSRQETETLKAMLFAKAGAEAALFRRLASATDAHSVLDNIL